jgi:hypothetical protein
MGSRLVPTTQTHPTYAYVPAPLLSQLPGGVYSPGWVVPPHSVVEDLDIVKNNN